MNRPGRFRPVMVMFHQKQHATTILKTEQHQDDGDLVPYCCDLGSWRRSAIFARIVASPSSFLRRTLFPLARGVSLGKTALR